MERTQVAYPAELVTLKGAFASTHKDELLHLAQAITRTREGRVRNDKAAVTPLALGFPETFGVALRGGFAALITMQYW